MKCVLILSRISEHPSKTITMLKEKERSTIEVLISRAESEGTHWPPKLREAMKAFKASSICLFEKKKVLI